MLILSGGLVNVLDRMRLIDLSALYRTRKPAPEKFEDKPAPPWLADIASAVSALDTQSDGSFLTLETVRKRIPKAKPVIPTKQSGSVSSQTNAPRTNGSYVSLRPHTAFRKPDHFRVDHACLMAHL